ncbi:hypothetical protein TRFO_15555 [Tritrichomonas foetus]|uniref:PRA1 family protein n=1 Tax=Tritrichomonas foetus TaxID=1144522 RepID=A0A1J4KSH6_9EUKA|nr:hypothetical protein TRFO_15555 [Tritrichomonas foetus]|eukprot:OHT14058.1 hypothetical protein TRFO_15555 [Tritrichomonas foetus]
MESSKQFANCLYNFLQPIEEDVYKFEDVALFLKRRKSALLYVLINLLFFGVYCLHLPVYSFVFLCLGLYFSLPFYFPLIKPFLRRLVLGKRVKNLPEDAPRKRYTIQQIAAFIGTLHYLLKRQIQHAKEGIEQKKLFLIAGTLFVLNFIFYLFLSISDSLALFIILNGILLLPFLLQLHVSAQFADLQDRLASVTSNFAISKEKTE